MAGHMDGTAIRVNATAPDGNLPLALQELWDAIDDLTEPATQFINGEAVHADGLLDQLVDELAGQQGNKHGSFARSMPPLWVDACDLLSQINTALDCWECGLPDLPRPRHLVHAPSARVQQLAKRSYRPQDVHGLEQITAALKAWAKKATDLLSPTPKWTLPNPCPACGEAIVYRKDPTGETIRQTALQFIGPMGCECLNCHHKWSPEYFQMLAKVLTQHNPRNPMNIDQLAALLRNTFWQALKDDDNPFGWFDQDGQRIDGKLPTKLFDQMATAVDTALKAQPATGVPE